jgi:hypothetical protein
MSGCKLQSASCRTHDSDAALPLFAACGFALVSRHSAKPQAAKGAAARALPSESSPWSNHMNLYVWLPALFLLGVAVMGLLFAFLAGCARI